MIQETVMRILVAKWEVLLSVVTCYVEVRTFNTERKKYQPPVMSIKTDGLCRTPFLGLSLRIH
jgi:hypothetical protein